MKELVEGGEAKEVVGLIYIYIFIYLCFFQKAWRSLLVQP